MLPAPGAGQNAADCHYRWITSTAIDPAALTHTWAVVSRCVVFRSTKGSTLGSHVTSNFCRSRQMRDTCSPFPTNYGKNRLRATACVVAAIAQERPAWWIPRRMRFALGAGSLRSTPQMAHAPRTSPGEGRHESQPGPTLSQRIRSCRRKRLSGWCPPGAGIEMRSSNCISPSFRRPAKMVAKSVK
jgi:hypothetical protein